jgi:hypothetical protein
MTLAVLDFIDYNGTSHTVRYRDPVKHYINLREHFPLLSRLAKNEVVHIVAVPYEAVQ